jgi:hypothetical protein
VAKVMGQVFKHAVNFTKNIQPFSVFVEIGSDRWEGSTEFLANLAAERNTILHSVDINSSASDRINNPSIKWHVGSGSSWCQQYSANIGKRIGLLYLDNFDYDWDINQVNKMIQDQKIEYLNNYGVTMNNQTCQIEHMKQIIALTPWLASQCIVMFDDTYRYNDCWIGKCGPAVVYLLALGFEIVRDEEREFGVIMIRG